MAEKHFTSPMHLSYIEPRFQSGRKSSTVVAHLTSCGFMSIQPAVLGNHNQPYLHHCVFHFGHLNQVIKHKQSDVIDPINMFNVKLL